MGIRKYIFYLIALSGLLTACASAPTSRPPGSDSSESPPIENLHGTHWTLVQINGRDPVPDTFVSLEISPEGIGGNAGCNGYGGKLNSPAAGQLALTEIASTMMACEPQSRMQQEADFLQALQEVNAYRLVEDRLELLDASGKVRLVFTQEQTFENDPAQLVGTRWQLISMNGQAPMEGSTITMEFLEDNQMQGSAGCRNYTGSYLAEPDRIGFPQIAMVELECRYPATLGLQESHFTDILTWANRYQLAEDKLEIYSSRGEVLTFEPLP